MAHTKYSRNFINKYLIKREEYSWSRVAERHFKRYKFVYIGIEPVGVGTEYYYSVVKEDFKL